MITQEEVLAIQDVKDILKLSWRDFIGKDIDQNWLRTVLELCDALWLYPGDPAPEYPHAELFSGLCSNGFADTLRALCHTTLCELFAYKMAEAIRRRYEGPINWVVGSDHAGAAFSHSVATWLGAKHDFCEKESDGQQRWKRFAIKPEEIMLQIEELMTTSKTLLAVRKGVREGNPNTEVHFAPLVGVLIHRSDVYEIEGSPVVYLAHFDIRNWNPAECPYCKVGSKRLRPKQHWAELTGKA